jgi:hypothetical protein
MSETVDTNHTSPAPRAPPSRDNLPSDPVASPSKMPFQPGGVGIRWYKPSFSETVRLLGWRWIYFLPAIALIAIVFYLPWRPAIIQIVFAWWKLLLFAIAIPTGVAINAAQHAIRNRRDPFCIHCGYSLTGLPDGHTCPECGSAFNLRVIEEYRRDPNWFIQRHRHATTMLPRADVPFDAGSVKSKRRSRDGT